MISLISTERMIKYKKYNFPSYKKKNGIILPQYIFSDFPSLTGKDFPDCPSLIEEDFIDQEGFS